MLGRPARWCPVWQNVIAGSWLMCSVCSDFTKHNSSAIFAVHGIDTPGILQRGEAAAYAGAVVGISAYLSLFVPAVFFAASYTPLTAAFERRLPFSPAGWLIVLLATALAIYGVLAVATEVIAELPLGVTRRPPQASA